MTGNKRRGLADFLGKELRAVPAPAPREEPPARVPKSQTSRVRERPTPPSPPPRREVEIEVEVAPALQAAVVSEVPESVSARAEAPAPESVSPGVPEVPPYLRLTRKEVRFRDEQLEALDRVVRRLVRARRGAGGERITENTLVRIAVDLLLERADALQGGTEAELLRALRGK